MSTNSVQRRITAEFVGTLFLVATVIGSGIMAERLAGANVALALLANTLATGAILVAYPFSGTPRGHRVLIDSSHYVEAMCAIDALGIAPMLGLQIEITSRDPHTGSEIWVRLDPGEGAWWEPETTVVLDGCVCTDGPSYRNWCAALNFFESGESALGYLVANPDLSGRAITLPEAIELGRAIFGDLLPPEQTRSVEER